MGTHPIFESDFDCLTGLRMGMLEAFNLAQTKVFNLLNPLKFFQGVGKPSSKMTKFLPKSRKSWAECYNKDEMMHVYTTTKAGFPTMTWMRSSKYSIHYIFSIAGFAAYLNWKVMSMQLQKNEDYRMEQGELQVPQYATNLGFGIRFLYLIIGFAALSALMLLPSRRVHNMYIHIPDKSLIIEGGRLFGTKPTYYIFDGKENERVRYILQKTKTKSDNMKGLSTDKISSGTLSYHPKLAYWGQTPRFFPKFLFLGKGEFLLNMNEIKSIQKNMPFAGDVVKGLLEYHSQDSFTLSNRGSMTSGEEFGRNRIFAPFLYFLSMSILFYSNQDVFLTDESISYPDNAVGTAGYKKLVSSLGTVTDE